MMCAYFDEEFAQEVVGSQISLFKIPENRTHFENLLDRDKVAWECVPSHEECRLAGYMCLQKGIDYPFLRDFAQLSKKEADRLWKTYTEINWEVVPNKLHSVLSARLRSAQQYSESQ
ncbi:MAG: hypothetical protein F6K37_07230 [Moorea sp. SIO4E2]|nr:hypothetical protein [Moorena producens]NEQ05746.1 hypothetical protein [Moorena sp. SIO4E2]NER91488.1 hypothetical protein [Moorena sp. SIO3A2]